MTGTNDTTQADGPLPPNLRFLRSLVTVLTVVMIVGIATIVGLMVWKFTAKSDPVLPASITLPDGSQPVAVTAGSDWFAVVTAQDEILIFDRTTGNLRQRVAVLVNAE